MKLKVNFTLIAVTLGIILATGIFEGCMAYGFSAILPIYIVLGCAAASAYMIIMKGVFTSPASTHFDGAEGEEKAELERKHAENFRRAKPLLIVVCSVIGALLIDSLLVFLVSSFPELSETALGLIYGSK
ncbi:MAG: hypothetical protein KBT31_03730 [Firmicutes bacterium]|nr:hypothetical protein [Candidatus Colimorpha enterica]